MRIILKCILEAQSRRLWIDIIWLGKQSSYGAYGHEHVGFIKSGEFTDEVRDC